MTQLTKLVSRDLPFTPYNVKWIPSSIRLCAVGATNRGAGTIAIYRLNGKQLELAGENELSTAIRCCTMGAMDTCTRQIATGDFEGDLQLWDPDRLEVPVASIRAHDTIVNMVAGSAPEFLTCSRDGLVKAWDARALEKPVFTVRHESEKDAWSVAFGGDDNAPRRLMAVGFDNGDFELYDLGTAQYIWKTNVGSGICSIDFANNSTTAVLSTLKGLHIIHLNRESPVESLKTLNDTTMWAASHLPQDPRYFGVVSGDGLFRVWDHQSSGEPAAAFQLGKHPIVSCDWNREKKGLFACGSFDQTIRIGFAQV